MGGRPKKIFRDVGLYLAVNWFEAGISPPSTDAALYAVINLWSKYGAGISEKSHVYTRLKLAKRYLKINEGETAKQSGQRLLLYPGTRSDRKDALALISKKSIIQDQKEKIAIDGWIWWWQFGDEHAKRGLVTQIVDRANVIEIDGK